MINNLGEGSIPKLMAKLAIPAVVAQVVNLLYNIVDRIYIGHIPQIGADAFTGVGLFTPVLMLLNAFAMLAGLIIVPVVSLITPKLSDEKKQAVFSCYEKYLLIRGFAHRLYRNQVVREDSSMRTRQTALRMIVLSFLLVGCMCIFAACAKSEKKASAAGVYHLYSMESDGDSYSHDDIVSYGLDSMTLTLYADGTASLGFGEETEQFQWKEGMLYSDEEEIAFTVENGMLTVSMDTESMVFERVKDAPEKMEVKNPEETTGTPTDDTEVSGTDLPQQ